MRGCGSEGVWLLGAEVSATFSRCSYTFSDLLGKEIPKLRRSIQDQSSAELTVRWACR